MKKVLLLCGLFALSMLSVAQETKRVAILETVDKLGNISYAYKLILRSNLAKAITNTSGYEAYDRTDIDAIMGEQDFQRTGNVSADQIKRVGEMTGAKFVLVAEAVLVDAKHMYITAKLLDVESARTEMTDNEMMGVTAKDIQRGCEVLAAKLVKPVVVATAKVTTPAPVQPKQEKPVPAKQEKPAPAPTVAPTPAPAPVHTQQPIVYSQPTTSAGQISKINNNEYILNGSYMDRKNYEYFINQNCPEAWKKHLISKRIIISGWVLLGSGAVLTCMWGLVGAHDESGEPYWLAHDLGIAFGSTGLFLMATSVPLISVGYGKKYNTYKTYNTSCASRNAVSLNLQASQNGLGLALHF